MISLTWSYYSFEYVDFIYYSAFNFFSISIFPILADYSPSLVLSINDRHLQISSGGIVFRLLEI